LTHTYTLSTQLSSACSGHPRALPSFPTRRSSDLRGRLQVLAVRAQVAQGPVVMLAHPGGLVDAAIEDAARTGEARRRVQVGIGGAAQPGEPLALRIRTQAQPVERERPGDRGPFDEAFRIDGRLGRAGRLG